ncbi:uncharacterized protein LOC110425135 isoform X6 [Herrania umbratica]|uniref:Uncharacterized protein LOC110425135 isoform X6 n=1 Tax=Herrania umbratica TaxID=108875 RepID=A0A6J1B8T5_9ROSI|nr:uncharacterized protein LOC110425135 isoform X6 [Herrania umbratica]
MHSHFPGPASSDPPPTLCTRRGRKLPKRRRTNSLSTPMLQGGHRLSKLWRSPITPLFNLCHRLLINFKFSSLSQAKGLDSLDEECEEFLPWLERKAGVEISSVLSIGKSAYGRSLFASEIIRTGDCISKVPYSVDSEWASYISCLPQHGEIHSTVLEQFPEIFESITLKDFMRAYFLVTSRAWESTKGLSLIPFTDFMNHDGVSDSIVLFDEDKKLSEVIADRNYVPGQEVLINYGNFPNATLPLDFGFTLPYNIHDQVQIHFNIPYHDCLREMKLELLQQHSTPKLKDAINCSEDTFLIKEVRSPRGKGKGLPQSLRAFARVLCCTAPEELSDLAMEAAQMDGRLARQPLKDSRRELLAHEMLLSHITHLMQKYDVAIKSLAPANFPSMSKKFALRRQMAHDLLTGELRVLNSASAWLNNYCAALRATIHCQSQ